MQKNRVKHLLYLSAMTFVLGGCSLFTSHYDAFRLQNYTSLKAYHVKFIEDNTASEGRVWSEDAVLKKCDSGYLKFSEAYEYALSKDKKDMTGSNTVKYLNEQFADNCEMLLKRKKLFSRAFVYGEDGMLVEIKQQYDYAISGEESRVGK